MKLCLSALATGLLLSSAINVGCATPKANGPEVAAPTPPPKKPENKKEALAKFSDALAELVKHEEAHDFNTATCTQVASLFDEAAMMQGTFAHATFNAGLVYQRCGDDKQARAHFEKAAKDDPSFYAAQAKVALFRFKDDGNADAAIDALTRAVTDGKFSDVSALVDLAAMQMARDGNATGVGCKDDMDCAKLNLQRGLAIDDSYMPAHNQLALYYFQLARKRVGSPTTKRGALSRSVFTPLASVASQKHGDVQQLELAALVCIQAIAKNQNYAPIHNTLGLIHNELGHVNSAVSEFGRAARLDPKFFEAQMNLAAVNLGFRGFEQAQAAYKRAIAVRPNDYDAHLGMAVALRGPIVDEGDPKMHRAKLAAVDAELEVAKKIDPNRPDAFYNDAIFVHEFKTQRETPAESIAALDHAEAAFKAFISKARGQPEYEGAIGRANERIKDIAVQRDFLRTPATPSKP